MAASLPFTLERSTDVISRGTVTSTTETVHGLLHLDRERLRVQWRLERKTDTVGPEIRTDREVERVREVTISLAGIGGAVVHQNRWIPWAAPRIVLTAADLSAFEEVSGEDGLRLEHPAELILLLRRADRIAAEEFAAELSLFVAERPPLLPGGSGTRPTLTPPGEPSS